MKKVCVVVLLMALVTFGCARVRVEAPKEPIRIDVSMRVDIYQHIQNDIDAIEDIVSGTGNEAPSTDQRSMLDYFIGTAYAQEGLDPAVKAAALRRKERLLILYSLMGKGIIGENKAGLLTIVDKAVSDTSVEKTVAQENSDRMLIYQALARSNNTALEEIQTLYASRLQNDAPPGASIEVFNGTRGVFEWKKK